MPIYYENDVDYATDKEELQDRRDAIQAKLKAMNKADVMDFDAFLNEEEIGDALHSKNRK